jgi:hypothetical protein
MLVFVLLEWNWRPSSGSGRWDGWKAFAPVIIHLSKAICRLMLNVFLPSQFAKEVFGEPPLFQYAKEVFWEAKEVFLLLVFFFLS